MTVVRLKWADTAATDLHLIPGLSSPELVRLLRVDDLAGETLTQDQPLPAGATVTFTPQLKAGDDHGLELTAAGEVTVKTPALRGHSFLLKVSLDQNPDITTRIRIHVHEKVSSIWLTPSRLTVRQARRLGAAAWRPPTRRPRTSKPPRPREPARCSYRDPATGFPVSLDRFDEPSTDRERRVSHVSRSIAHLDRSARR
jgi:hypothetical protein